MPRLPICTNRDEKDKPNFSGENDNLDICAKCWRGLDAEDVIGATEHSRADVEAAFADEDLETGCDHPDYADEDYHCELCGKHLTEKDN